MIFNKATYLLTNKIFLSEVKKNISPCSFKEAIEKTIPYGYILSNELIKKLDEEDLNNLIFQINSLNVPSQSWTKTFYKNWKIIEKKTDFSFTFDQMVHYLYAYYSDLGLMDSDEIYVPNTEIENFSMREYLSAPIRAIKEISIEEVEEIIDNLVSSGIALSQEKIGTILNSLEEVDLNPMMLLDNSKNREFSCLVRKRFNIIPNHPLDFLRQVVYIATGKTLLIKDKDTIEALKNSEEAQDWLNSYCIQVEGSMVELSKYFYRFKPLILAMKNEKTANHVNRIRRLAKKNHVPMERDYFSSIAERIKNDRYIDFDVFLTKVETLNSFRIISLLKALNNLYIDNKIYRIRNGKVWAKTEETETFYPQVTEIEDILINLLVKRVTNNLYGKKIYIPKNITYALPTSEKDFVGSIPCGSYVEIDNKKSALLGVHWTNLNDYRVDLDLSLMSLNEKIGWDANYRNSNFGLWFSGDITHAPEPDGATEFFRVNGESDLAYTLNLNHYNYNSCDCGEKAKYSILIGEMNSEDKDRIFVPSAKIFEYSDTLENKTKTLGIYIQKDGNKKFYFQKLESLSGRTAKNSETNKILIKNLLERFERNLTLTDLLKMSVIDIVETPSEADIDLSVDNLSSDSVIKLFI
jgi:hypothetical protein